VGGVWGAVVVGVFGVEASPSSYVGKMWEALLLLCFKKIPSEW
jgi:hypothetical protein